MLVEGDATIPNSFFLLPGILICGCALHGMYVPHKCVVAEILEFLTLHQDLARALGMHH